MRSSRHPLRPMRSARVCYAAVAALVVGGLLLSRPSPALDNGAPLYQVEVVVFRTSAPAGGEDWSVHPPARGFGANPGHSGATPEVVRVLAASDYRLAGIDARLRSSGGWRVVAHAAWVQSAGTWGAHIGVPLADVGITAPELQGSVYVERAPIYLHVGFDLGLHSGTNTYWIDEMRSAKYGDKLYFDHPGFGIIAEVTPVKRSP